MIIDTCEQLSEEWFTMHAGVPGAASMGKIITPTGKPSTQAKTYLYKLAGEAVLGRKEEGFSSEAMQRGVTLEAEARKYYEMINDCEVEQVGFCFKDERRIVGCSPDGLVGDNGGLEIKCPNLSTHVGYLLNEKLPTIYIPQVQGSLWVTDRAWWDFLSYYPGMRPLLIRVERDEAYITKLEMAVTKFLLELQKITKKLKGV